MSFSTEFEALMVDSLVVSGLASVSDMYGTAGFSTAGTTYKARYVIKQELVRTLEGTEELSRAMAWVNSTSTFSPWDKYTINGSTVGPLMAVNAYPDEDGTHHVRLAFG